MKDFDKENGFIKSRGDNYQTIHIKPYEEGVTLSQKISTIMVLGDITPNEMAHFLGETTNDIFAYVHGDKVPDKLAISTINKLFRLWYEKRNINN